MMDIFYAELLTLLFILVPMIFRILAHWEGTTQKTHVELGLMNRVFVFKMIVCASRVVPDKRFSHVYQASLFLPTLSTFLFSTDFNLELGTDSLTNRDVATIIQDLTSSSTFFLT